ncbi:MAG: hypothetical protein HY817_04170 [Candidatus Abawacabacteria bacterium]|nr:hypothetical protein [Candidatus Abawacabacteria bacterium]
MQKKFLIGFALVFSVGVFAPGYLVYYMKTNPASIPTLIPYFIFGFPILIFVLVIGFNIWFRKGMSPSNKQNSYLLQNGEKASAKILTVEDTGITLDRLYLVIRITMQVMPTGRNPFSSILEIPVSRVQIPRPGDMVQVLFDPQNPQSIMLTQ